MFHQRGILTLRFLNNPIVKAKTLIFKSKWRKQSEVKVYGFLLLEVE